LDFEGTKEMLHEKGIDKSRFEKIYKLSSGNPFFIESMVGLEGYIHDEMYSELSNEERELIGFLSTLRTAIPENCLNQRDHGYSKVLPLLAQKSILKTDTNNLFYVHDIIKDFFYIKLSSSQRLANHLYAGIWFEETKEARYLIEAIYHYQEAGEKEKAGQIAIENAKSIIEEGLAGEFLGILDRFDEKSLESNTWAEILILKGKAHYMGGEWKQGLLHFNFSSDFASLFGYKEIEARALCEAGYVLDEYNHIDRAKDCFEKSLAISNTIDYPLGICNGYRGIGRAFWKMDKYDQALENFRKTIEISKEYKQFDILISTYIDYGNILDEMHETEKAIDAYNKSISILKNYKNTSEFIRANNNLGITYRNNEQYEAAIECYNNQMKLINDFNDIQAKGYGYAGLGLCYAKVNEYNKAKEYIKEAEKIAKYIENENIMYVVNWTYGIIYRHNEKWEEAINYFNKSLEFLKKNKITFRIPDIHNELGLLYKNANQIEAANKHFNLAKQLYNNK
jgi:tetratricopeptide (TPR) repeat protein